MQEEMVKRIAQRMIGQTVGFEDQFHTADVLLAYGVTRAEMERGDTIHFGAFVDVELLSDEDGEPYYQVTFLSAGEEVGQ